MRKNYETMFVYKPNSSMILPTDFNILKIMNTRFIREHRTTKVSVRMKSYLLSLLLIQQYFNKF